MTYPVLLARCLRWFFGPFNAVQGISRGKENSRWSSARASLDPSLASRESGNVIVCSRPRATRLPRARRCFTKKSCICAYLRALNRQPPPRASSRWSVFRYKSRLHCGSESIRVLFRSPCRSSAGFGDDSSGRIHTNAAASTNSGGLPRSRTSGLHAGGRPSGERKRHSCRLPTNYGYPCPYARALSALPCRHLESPGFLSAVGGEESRPLSTSLRR